MNTDLLDKAKLEKKIASLEGERKSFSKGRRESELKLEGKTGKLRNNQATIAAMTEDWEKFTAAARTDQEGNRQGSEKKQTEQQPESPHADFVRSHLVIRRPGLTEPKGMKL